MVISTSIFLTCPRMSSLTTDKGIMYLDLPIVFGLLRRWPQYQRLSTTGGLITMCLALGLSSFATNTTHLIITQGVIYALGGSFAYSPCIISLMNGSTNERASPMASCGLALVSPALSCLWSWSGCSTPMASVPRCGYGPSPCSSLPDHSSTSSSRGTLILPPTRRTPRTSPSSGRRLSVSFKLATSSKPLAFSFPPFTYHPLHGLSAHPALSVP